MGKGRWGGSGRVTMDVENPFNLIPNHKLKMGKKVFKEFKQKLVREGGIQETIKYVEHNGQKYIVDGHHRVRAAKELGLKEVPIEKVNLPYKGYKITKDLYWI